MACLAGNQHSVPDIFKNTALPASHDFTDIFTDAFFFFVIGLVQPVQPRLIGVQKNNIRHTENSHSKGAVRDELVDNIEILFTVQDFLFFFFLQALAAADMLGEMNIEKNSLSFFG